MVFGISLYILICLVWYRTDKTTNMEKKKSLSEYEFHWNGENPHFFILECSCS